MRRRRRGACETFVSIKGDFFVAGIASPRHFLRRSVLRRRKCRARSNLNICSVYDPHMQRTICIKLTPAPAQAAALAETSRQFTAVFNAVCAYGWQHMEKNGIEL